MRLNSLAKELSGNAGDDGKTIDFGAAGLYLPGAQTIFATTTSAAVSILACWMIPMSGISAVRTLALTATAGVLIIRRPIKIGNTKGVNTIFSALRPCCLLYVCCLVLEQLVHTCVGEESTYEHGFWRRVIYHVNMTVMTTAAFIRSKNPRAENDLPFLIACLALLIIALLPPPALALSGPLCSPPTLMGAGERMLRAFMFSCVYVVLVYSAAPISNNLGDTLVCIARSATASAWVLGAVVYSIPLAAVQICVILYSSFAPSSLQYDSVARLDDIESNASLVDRSPAQTNHHAHHAHMPTVEQAMERVPRAVSPAMTEADFDEASHAVAATGGQTALTLVKHPNAQRAAACLQPINGGGLTFNLSMVQAPGANGMGGSTVGTAAISNERLAEIAATIQ